MLQRLQRDAGGMARVKVKRRIVVDDSDTNSDKDDEVAGEIVRVQESRNDRGKLTAEVETSDDSESEDSNGNLKGFVVSDIESTGDLSEDGGEDILSDSNNGDWHEEEVDSDEGPNEFVNDIRKMQAQDACDEGYGVFQVLHAIMTACYRPFRQDTERRISDNLSICVDEVAQALVKDMCALRLCIVLAAGQSLYDEFPHDILFKIVSLSSPKAARHVMRGGGDLYVVSTDTRKDHNYITYLLPLLLAMTGVRVVADAVDNEEPFLTGFTQDVKINFPVGMFCSVGCFCRQKHLNTLFGVRHTKSGITFLVGSSCVEHFNQYSDDKWHEEHYDKVPHFLAVMHKLNFDGLIHTGTNVLQNRVAASVCPRTTRN